MLVKLNFLSFRLEKRSFRKYKGEWFGYGSLKKKTVRAEVEYHIVIGRIKTVGTWNCIGAYSECPYIGQILRNYVTDTTQQNPSCELKSL